MVDDNILRVDDGIAGIANSIEEVGEDRELVWYRRVIDHISFQQE